MLKKCAGNDYWILSMKNCMLKSFFVKWNLIWSILECVHQKSYLTKWRNDLMHTTFLTYVSWHFVSKEIFSTNSKNRSLESAFIGVQGISIMRPRSRQKESSFCGKILETLKHIFFIFRTFLKIFSFFRSHSQTIDLSQNDLMLVAFTYIFFFFFLKWNFVTKIS